MNDQRWLILTFCAVIATYLILVLGIATVCLIYAKELVESTTLVCDKRDRGLELLGVVLATVVALLQGRSPKP